MTTNSPKFDPIRETLRELGSYLDPNIGTRLDIAFPDTFMALYAVLDYCDKELDYPDYVDTIAVRHIIRARIAEALIGC